MRKSPRLFLRAAFVLNERQFLSDQAVLSDARADTIQPLLPLDRSIFEQFVSNYEKNTLLLSSRKAKDIAIANISKRLPVDILWLFNHSMAFEGMLETRQTMQDTVDRGSAQYIELTLSLMKHHFASVQTEQSYQSILDLKDIFNVDNYRINSLH
jgi:hypothetical protein